MLLVLMPDVGQAGDKVRLTLMEYAPLIGKRLEGNGIEPTIVTAAFKKVNVDAEYIFFPPARSYQAAEEGVYDGTIGWVWSEERESRSITANPFLKLHCCCFI